MTVWDGVTIDTTALIGYGYRDTITVDGVAWPRYVGYMAAGLTEFANQSAAALAAGQTAINNQVAAFVDTSSTSDTIGLGSTTITVGLNKGFRAGMIVTSYATADPTQWMTGLVTAYTAATGVLVFNATGSNGSGTYAAWTVALSGVQGNQGIQGVQGVIGLTGPTGAGSNINAQNAGSVVTAAPRPTVNAIQSLAAADDAANTRINLALVGDTASPGNSMLYGTNSSGVRGWQTFPSNASPGPIGNTTPSTASFTTLAASSTVSGAGFTAYMASPPAIGGTAPSTGAFTTLSASSTVSGTGFTNYMASPPAIGGSTPAAGTFNSLKATGGSFEARIAMGANNIDLSVGSFFTKTISGATSLTVSNIPASGTAASFILELTNGGSAVITWWSGMKWPGGSAPTLTSSGVDVLGFYCTDGGTTWRGLIMGKGMA